MAPVCRVAKAVRPYYGRCRRPNPASVGEGSVVAAAGLALAFEDDEPNGGRITTGSAFVNDLVRLLAPPGLPTEIFVSVVYSCPAFDEDTPPLPKRYAPAIGLVLIVTLLSRA